MKVANLAVRFILELCALAALAYWGFQSGDSLLMKLFLGIGAPLLAAAVWGAFIAPKAWRRLADPWRLLLELVVWLAAIAALVAAGQPTLAVVFAVVLVVSTILMFVWGQRNVA
ncbi:MAG: YrdB family protein [Anaerolineae bacterium]